MRPFSTRLMATAAFLCSMAAPAAATQIFDSFNTSTGINSNAMRVNGTITGRPGSGGFNAESWTVEVFAFAGECLRLDMLSSSAGDLALGAASPSPLVYFRDDDSGIGLNPLVKINAPFTGWYSVTLVRALYAARRLGVPVLYRGDSHLLSGPRDWRRTLWTVKTWFLLRKFAGFLSPGRRVSSGRPGTAGARSRSG